MPTSDLIKRPVGTVIYVGDENRSCVNKILHYARRLAMLNARDDVEEILKVIAHDVRQFPNMRA